MNISMAGVDYKTAPLSLREKIAFDTDTIKRLTLKITAEEQVDGCVIISTCNRTEIYISGRADGAALFFKHCGADYGEFRDCLICRHGTAAARYLAEVACGLHSAILCEEQIVTQLGDAIELSRRLGCADAVLNTMFRCAVTAGKRALTDYSVRNVPLSSADKAVELAEKLYGSLEGKRALVIGNGKMGRLAAEAVLAKGGSVCITLRRYKHGENIVPKGADTVEYSDRYTAMAQCDFVISATRSPHYTIQVGTVKLLGKKPDCIFDLAVPRDAEPGTEHYTRLIQIDDLCDTQSVNEAVIGDIKKVADKYADEFEKWLAYREGLTE